MMKDAELYLTHFQKASDLLNKILFAEEALEVKVGLWLDSVVLKIQKSGWRNNNPQSIPFENGIFFSVWISDDTVKRQKIFYNIHALKLRNLNNYNIQSREFAQAFRLKFEPFKVDWPNVKTDMGPLTLMEGWVPLTENNFEGEITDLANKFLNIAFIIDDLLTDRLKLR